MMLAHDYPPELHGFAAVLDRFGPGRCSGGSFWYASCPIHADDSPSLAFWLGEKGQLVFGCHACGDGAKPAILRAAGLGWSDLYPKGDGKAAYQGRKAVIEAVYDYRDESDGLLYQTVRYKPKRFAQRRPMPDGGHAWTLDGGLFRKVQGQWRLMPKGHAEAEGDVHLEPVRRVLYLQNEVLAADRSRAVLVVAGEKDADTAWHHGFVATTNVCGEKAPWLEEYSTALSDRRVLVVPDGDEPGRRHAEKVLGSLAMHDLAALGYASLPAKDLTAFVEELAARGVADVHGEVEAALKRGSQWYRLARGGAA